MENYLSYLSYLSISFEEKKDFWRKMLNRGSFFTHEKTSQNNFSRHIFCVDNNYFWDCFFHERTIRQIGGIFKRLFERFQKIHIKQSEEYKSPSKEFLIH